MYNLKYLFKILALATFPIYLVAQDSPDFETKVDPLLKEDLKAGKTVPAFFAFRPTKPILEDVFEQYGQEDSRPDLADDCQRDLSYLSFQDTNDIKNALYEFPDFKVNFESFWTTNTLYIENCNLKIANIVLNIGKNVTSVEGDTKYPPFKMFQEKEFTSHEDNEEITWALKKIEVEKAWELVGGAENAGKGTIVGIMSTGLDKDSLKENNDYNYGFMDPLNWNRRRRSDYSGHGTHIAGTIVGKNGIGVAPGAEFIACKACDIEKGCPRIYIERCGYFLFCPSGWKVTVKGCKKLCDVIHLGFGIEDTTPQPWFTKILELWAVAKVIPVVAVGNGGGKCNSVTYPGNLKGMFTVGWSTENDGISETTSFGPVDGSSDNKPDFVAPGTNIKSVGLPRQKKYAVNGGLGSAAAHVTGLIAIMRGINTELGVEEARSLISNNADFDHPRSADGNCEGKSDDDKPNFKYGYGRINAFKTIKAMK